MTLKKIIPFLGAGLCVLLIVLYAVLRSDDPQIETMADHGYLLDKNFLGSSAPPLLPKGALLPDGALPEDGLGFFRALERHFAQPSLAGRDRHFAQVDQYFNSLFSPGQAQRLFELYKKYLNCEIQVATRKEFQAKTAAPGEILLRLHKIQNYRRRQLGQENADALFGQEVKAREYMLRQAMIVADPKRYGQEKQSQLKTLRQEMWGDETDMAGQEASTAYDRYQLQLRIYRKDLSEMSAPERQLKIEAFRKEFFPQEIVERLEAVDRQLSADKQKNERYRLAEQRILNDSAIDQEEKDKRIETLQQEFFGGEAEAFRRRQAIYESNGKKEMEP